MKLTNLRQAFAMFVFGIASPIATTSFAFDNSGNCFVPPSDSGVVQLSVMGDIDTREVELCLQSTQLIYQPDLQVNLGSSASKQDAEVGLQHMALSGFVLRDERAEEQSSILFVGTSLINKKEFVRGPQLSKRIKELAHVSFDGNGASMRGEPAHLSLIQDLAPLAMYSTTEPSDHAQHFFVYRLDCR